jgi:hypothetical protein
MSLLLPAGLAALLALPVIVLLHMRHTSPRPKPVPALRFWLAARPEQTQQTRLRRPPFSLLLLLQLLAAAALALALARPAVAGALGALGIDLQTEPRHLIVLLDGSTSMAAQGEAAGRTRYEEARADALARLAALSDGDVATVLLLGTRTATLSATDAAGFGQLRERLAATPLPGGRADLDAALGLGRDLLLPGRENEVVVLSDGAFAVDPATVGALGAPVEFRRFGGASGDANAAVVSVTARAGGEGGGSLYARLANFGPEPLTAPVLLLADGIEAGRQEVTLPAAGGTVELAWPLPPGASDATVVLEVADAFAADNRADLPLAAGDLSLRILLVSDVPSPLARVLAAIEGARLTVEPGERLNDPAGLGNHDLMVLEGVAPVPGVLDELRMPLLIVAPPDGGPLPTDGVMVEPEIERLRSGDPLLAGVDLSGVTFGESPVIAAAAGQQEVVGAAEGPLVLRTTVVGEPAVVLAFDPSVSNLPRRVAFPILIANAVAELAPAPLPETVALGDPLRVQPRAGTAAVEIAPPTGDPVTLAFDAADESGTPREALFAGTGLPGSYGVVERDEAGAETGGGRFVVNAGHPRESDLRPTPGLAETLAAAEGTTFGPAGGSGAAHLWPLLVLAALGLLVVEWLVWLLPRRRLSPVGVASSRSGSGSGFGFGSIRGGR